MFLQPVSTFRYVIRHQNLALKLPDITYFKYKLALLRDCSPLLIHVLYTLLNKNKIWKTYC